MAGSLLLVAGLIIGLYGLKLAIDPSTRRVGVLWMVVGGVIVGVFILVLAMAIGNMG